MRRSGGRKSGRVWGSEKRTVVVVRRLYCKVYGGGVGGGGEVSSDDGRDVGLRVGVGHGVRAGGREGRGGTRRRGTGI